ncbi:MAG: hypothetical protein ACI89E_002449 [Planctomycetota bacterium]|jgi:hypothetical protein
MCSAPLHSIKSLTMHRQSILALLLAAGLTSVTSVAYAITPKNDVAAPAVLDEANLAEACKRILKFADGRSVRGLFQKTGGVWQLRRKGAWLPVGQIQVISSRKESDLLREARKLAQALPKDNLGAQTSYAEWLIGVGLIEEATQELDKLLNHEPDFQGALDLLRPPAFLRPRAPTGIDLPEQTAGTLIIAGSQAAPVRKELLIGSLKELQETEPGREALRRCLLKGLHAASVGQRRFSAHAMRRLMPGEELLPLMQRCALDVSGPVRREAALAVRAAKDPGLVIPLVKALNSKSRGIRTNATESLGIIGSASAVPALVTHFANLTQSGGGGVAATTSHIRIGSHFAYVQDFDLEIANSASAADPIVRHTQDVVQLEARVGGISGYTYVTEYRTIHNSLKKLTNANPGSSPADWSSWYEKHKERYSTR